MGGSREDQVVRRAVEVVERAVGNEVEGVVGREDEG